MEEDQADGGPVPITRRECSFFPLPSWLPIARREPMRPSARCRRSLLGCEGRRRTRKGCCAVWRPLGQREGCRWRVVGCWVGEETRYAVGWGTAHSSRGGCHAALVRSFKTRLRSDYVRFSGLHGRGLLQNRAGSAARRQCSGCCGCAACDHGPRAGPGCARPAGRQPRERTRRRFYSPAGECSGGRCRHGTGRPGSGSSAAASSASTAAAPAEVHVG
jgi:hypothetical protein